jgi:hypothetical protein
VRDALDRIPREPAGILELLVLSDAVEPHRPRQLHVRPKRGVVGRRQSSGRPVSLIQHESKRIRPVVEHHAVALRGDGTQRGVARDLVHELAAPGPELQLSLDERRRLRAPQQLVAVIVDPRVRQGDPPMDFAAYDGVRVVGNDLGPTLKAYMQP